MRGFTVDIKQSPMSRRTHATIRLGCAFLVLFGLVGTWLVQQRSAGLSALLRGLIWSALIIMWLAIGVDFPMILEGYKAYWTRYQSKLEEAQRRGAELFESAARERGPGDPPT